MTELEILEALLEVYQTTTGESGTMPEDIEVMTQSMIEVREAMLQIQEQNAKMYVMVGLIQTVLFVTCVITLVRGWVHGGRN